MKRVSLKRIAEEANVSVPLVSQVLNNKSVRVSSETKKTIIELAGKYGYVPNRIASALKSRKTNAVAILAPFTSLGFFSELIYHIEAAAMARGFNTLVLNTFGEREKELKALQFCLSRMIDGFFIAPQDMRGHADLLGGMRDEGLPFVFVDRYVEGIDSITISSDHRTVAYDITRDLIERKRRRIGYVRRINEPENSTQKNRMDGYIQAMREHGLEPRIIGFSFDSEERSDLAGLLSTPADDGSGREMDALFLASGYYMPHLLRACREAGRDVDGIDFMTVDGFAFPFEFIGTKEILGKLNGHMGVAVQDTKLIASLAVDALVDAIQGREAAGCPRYVPVSLHRL